MATNNKETAKTRKSRSDTAVQGTNDCSIVSKCSAANLGYVQDDYVKYMVAKCSRRAPIINRGYYIRGKVMDHVFKAFLNHYKCGNQILGLGAGFDSAYFRLSADGMLENTVYFEVDFSQVMSRKCALIRQRSALFSLLKNVRTASTSSEIVLDTENYKLLGVDLMNVAQLNATLKAAGFDPNKPTLIISEVVLTYMTHKNSSCVIEWAANHINHGVFVTYEQILPDDGFGKFMLRHFDKIGSPLRTIQACPSLQRQIQRYNKLGWSYVQGLDLNFFSHHILPWEEKHRMTLLEPFDEFEEWHLKCNHYMVLTAYKGKCEEFSRHLWPHTASVMGETVTFGDFLDSRSMCNEIFSADPVISESCFKPKTLNTRNGETVNSAAALSKRFGHTMNCIKVKYRTDDAGNGCASGESSNCEQMLGSAGGNSLLLVVGGFGELVAHHGRFKDPHMLDVESCTWQPVASLSADGGHDPKLLERMYHTSTVLSNPDTVVIYGGRLSPVKPCADLCILKVSASAQDGLRYKLTAQETGGAVLPASRWRHSATAIQWKGKECIFVYGGRNHQVTALDDCFLLDTETWIWTQIQPLGTPPVATHTHTADLWDGSLLVYGGLDQYEVPQGSIHSLSLGDWQWQKLDLTGHLRPRYCHTSAVVRDQLFLVGGVSTCYPPPGVAVVTLHTKSIQEYNWPTLDSSIVMVHNHRMALTDNKLIILGGGGNCFSFGTHFNEVPHVLDLDFFQMNS